MRYEWSIQLQNVSYSYASRDIPNTVFNDLSLTIYNGEIVGIFGESGIGKSTLLSLLCGELEPVTGCVESTGILKGAFGYHRQADTLLPFRTVSENVNLLCERLANKEDFERPDPLLALQRVGLRDRASAYPGELSGGMRQRVQLAQSVISKPALLLLDEPFSQQDLATQIKLEEWLFEIVSESGTSAVIVSHDLSALASLCSRVLVLGGHPANIHSSEEIDGEIGSLSPAHRRNSKGFSPLMTRLWEMRLEASQC